VAEVEDDRLRAALEQVGGLEAVEIQEVVARLRAELAALTGQLEQTREQVLQVRDVVTAQARGLYDVVHPAETSTSLEAQLSAVRAQIRYHVVAGLAVSAMRSYRLNKSATDGKRLIEDLSAAMLLAYNAEAENAIRTVEPGGLVAARARLQRIADRVVEVGRIVDLRITAEYHRLRMTELELAARHEAALAAEADLEREHLVRLREATRVSEGLRRERAILEQEREHCAGALALVHSREDIEAVEGFAARLDDIDRALADLDQRTVSTRSGYVYVISNIGSFGDRVLKIGVTRRPDPTNYVRELSDESVPFDFDVHALFFSEDAVGVRAMLHHHFADRRVNLVNQRREFFYATPLEVLDVLAEHRVGGLLEFRTRPGAAEYRTSLELAAAR